MSMIELNNVSKKLGDFALQNVSFTVPEGCIMGFIGENGAGKTTTIRSMLNLLTPDSGSITMFDKDFRQYEKEIKQDIGVVFDESTFHDNLKIKDIASIMRPMFTKWDDTLYMHYVNKFQLPLHKICKEYSKGMRMKLSLAAALSHHPKLLILDEATSGLDPVIRDEILDVFLDFIQDESKSIFMSTHITGDIDKIADYITFLHKGKIVFSASKDELKQEYGLLKIALEEFSKVPAHCIAGYRKNQFGYEVLVKNRSYITKALPQATLDAVSIEDIMLYMIRGEK